MPGTLIPVDVTVGTRPGLGGHAKVPFARTPSTPKKIFSSPARRSLPAATIDAQAQSTSKGYMEMDFTPQHRPHVMLGYGAAIIDIALVAAVALAVKGAIRRRRHLQTVQPLPG
jgi:hypothetical protein